MKYLTHYAVVPRGGSVARLGRTGVESINKSKAWSRTLLYGGLGVLTGIVAVKVVEHFTNKPANKVVDVEVKAVAVEAPSAEVVEDDVPIEVRIRQLRAEGKNYPSIARELHVSIRVISRVLKSKDV